MYTELVKDVRKIQSLIRDFYVFGYKSRNDYDKKSGKTYDNEKRRIESYFDEMFSGVTDKNGKRVSILINGDSVETNPLYRVFKSKSFTDNDLVLHFLIIDVLTDLQCATASDIILYISKHGYAFQEGITFDIGILRLKLNEYVELGLLKTLKEGNKLYYTLSEEFSEDSYDWDMLKYFREVNVLGVIGSYITDRKKDQDETYIKYKHRQLFGALDSATLLTLLDAIHEKKILKITKKSRGEIKTRTVASLKIIINRQNGRQYLAAYDLTEDVFVNYRLDHITEIKSSDRQIDPEKYMQLFSRLEERLLNTWNINFHLDTEPKLTEMIIQVAEDEFFILNRLRREGHGGEVKQLSDEEYLYSIRLYDPSEMMPWVKSFIGRIVSFSCEDKRIEERFYRDLDNIMEEMAND